MRGFAKTLATFALKMSLTITTSEIDTDSLKSWIALPSNSSHTTFPFADLVRLDSIKNVWLTGDVKEVDCDAAYITANFDGTGLGINERAGWAICNGDNGTKDRGGRVSVGYETVTVDPSNNVWDAIYNTIGATGGEKRHTLITSEMPAHTHSIQPAYVTGTSAPSNVRTDSTSGSVGQAVTGSTGGGGSHENRQPFIVTLFIQKL